MLLGNKNAVIYGAGGAVGRAVAHAFSREGARVFLAGRTLSKLEAVAAEISAAGGMAETAVVDALEQQAIEAHAADVVRQAGRIDISLNAISMDDVQGISLAEMSLDDFVRPIDMGTRSQFLTATTAARLMVGQGAGTILMLTATPARLAIPHCGGFGVACAALEGLCRQLAVEVGPKGVRVVCLRSAGSPESIPETMDMHAAAGEVMSMITLMEPPMTGIMAPAEVAENGFPDGFIFRSFVPVLQRPVSSLVAMAGVYGTSRLRG